MAAPPPKIKEFLGQVKECVVDGDHVDSLSALIALLQLEILQRGVITTVSGSGNDKQLTNILDSVTSVAGKALLDQSASYPKPLMAGSAAMAGRVAERIEDLSSSKIPANLATALSRCKDVGDDRLRGILLIFKEARDLGPENMRNRVLYLAEGYYYRAAYFQPDLPPMYKRAWDCLLARNNGEPSFAANFSLSNLHRIASSKGNHQRAAELSLSLVESLLNKTVPSMSHDASWQLLTTAHLDPYRPPLPVKPSIEDRKKAIKSATAAMISPDEASSSLEGPLLFWHKLLQLQLEVVRQNTELEEQIVFEYGKQQNRSASKIQRDKVQAQVTEKYLPSWDQAVNLHEAATDLQLAVAESKGSDRQQQACQSLLLYLNDCRRRTRSRSGWQRFADWVAPTLAHLATQSGWASSDESNSGVETIRSFFASVADAEDESYVVWIQTCLGVVPLIEWVLSGWAQSTSQFSTEDMLLTRDALSVTKTRLLSSVTRSKSSLVQKGSSADDEKLVRIDNALVAATSWIVLSCDEPSHVDVRNISEAALAMKGDHVDEPGAAWLSALVAWSGLWRTSWQFCTVAEARRIIQRARVSINHSTAKLGRPKLPTEEALSTLALADAEALANSGGLVREVPLLFDRISEILKQGCDSSFFVSLVQIHMRTTWAGLVVRDAAPKLPRYKDARDELVEWMQSDADELVGPVYIWRGLKASETLRSHQIVAGRQVVADSFLKEGAVSEAESFLVDAVKEAPTDSNAAFALGAFRLRIAFHGDKKSRETKKAAQTQLLKAAKLDSTKPDPFALLGYWYEYNGDLKRAIGCYSKALMLDAANPVAGRGLVRLKTLNETELALENAIDSNSALNGWAWLNLANRKLAEAEKDNLAVVALVKALRTRDLDRPDAEPLAWFYAAPTDPQRPRKEELVSVLSTLGACYRRLGRLTAAVRTFYTAIDTAGDTVTADLLHACATTEMDLGLFEEAASNLSQAMALTTSPPPLHLVHAFGLSCFSLAQKSIDDGKAGVGYGYVQKGVATCDACVSQFVCMKKLHGDIHSLAAALPARVFASDSAEEESIEALVKKQIEFVRTGHLSFVAAANLVDGCTEEEAMLKASLLSDAACNKMLTAQLEFLLTKDDALFDDVEADFKEALAIDPVHSPAWCGFGCAVSKKDPLLAQHAFSRAIELDSLAPDPYSNLGFLYTNGRNAEASVDVSNTLTQIADSPTTWINQAMILEQKSAVLADENRDTAFGCARQAADAYRASLQVSKYDYSLLGLAMSNRLFTKLKHNEVGFSRQAFSSFMEEYIARTGGLDESAVMLASMPNNNRSGTKEPKSTFDSSDESSLIIRPDDGPRWVAIAKKMISNAESTQGLEAPRIAARRSRLILESKVFQYSGKEEASGTSRASQLVESLCDSFALNSLLGSEEENDNDVPSNAILDTNLQKALLLSPGNHLVRSALASIV